MLIKATRLILYFSLMPVLISSCGIFAQDNFSNTKDSSMVDEEILFRSSLTEYAESLIGTKYRYAGRSTSGFDCSGLVLYVMKEHNIEMASSSGTQEKQGKKITKEEAKPGDLVFFRRTKNGRVFHVGLIQSNHDGALTMVHSSSRRGVVLEEIEKSSYWRKKHMTFRDVVTERNQ